MRNTDRVNIAGHGGWKFLKLSHIKSKKIVKKYLVKMKSKWNVNKVSRFFS